MTWAEFSKLPKDLKEEYMNNLIEKYNANARTMADVFGVSVATVFRVVKNDDLNVTFLKGKHPSGEKYEALRRFMDGNAGEGEIYLDKNVFKLKGVMHGDAVDFSVSTDKIGAFPITPGDHFDIYIGGNLVYVYPEPDPRATVKWVCFLDKLNLQRQAEKEAANI
jgi:hypothetical protein